MPTFSQSRAPRTYRVRYSAALPFGTAYLMDDDGVTHLTDDNDNLLVVEIG